MTEICSRVDETVAHIMNEYPTLGQCHYTLRRHDEAAKQKCYIGNWKMGLREKQDIVGAQTAKIRGLKWARGIACYTVYVAVPFDP